MTGVRAPRGQLRRGLNDDDDDDDDEDEDDIILPSYPVMMPSRPLVSCIAFRGVIHEIKCDYNGIILSNMRLKRSFLRWWW